jgi:branched-chain amino acid aminotransferase
MELFEELIIHRTKHSQRSAVDWDHLEFGKYHTDHMLVCDYEEAGWKNPQILPYANLSLDPMSLALHYGQTIFEGMKAFRMLDGQVNIFRPFKHHSRLTRSAKRMCMPEIPEDLFLEGLKKLLTLDRDWVPGGEGESLYIRPFMIATEARLGVKISDQYRYMVLCSPAGTYYQKPLRVKIEKSFVRASKGGAGYAKCGGNYGAAFYPAKKAKEEGYDQVLWTDSTHHRYIEESGTTNLMFVIDNILVTPALSDSILDGVTRDCFLTLARHKGIHAEERPISVDELRIAFEKGILTEAFCVGTAAVATSIETIGLDGVNYQLPAADPNAVVFKLKNELDHIRTGRAEDLFGWNYIL